MNIKKLYCGGKFHFDGAQAKARQGAESDYRTVLLGNVDLLLDKHDYVPIRPDLHYIGPFYFEVKDMIDRLIVEAEWQMIESSTDAVFLLDEDGCCPGSIAELTYACLLKKRVAIFYVKTSEGREDAGNESSKHSPCWFAITAAEITNPETVVVACENYSDATNRIAEYIKSL